MDRNQAARDGGGGNREWHLKNTGFLSGVMKVCCNYIVVAGTLGNRIL